MGQTVSTVASASALQAITAAVTALYERHPYPCYPLLAKPHWQDGYLAHSGFSQRLLLDQLQTKLWPSRLPSAAPAGGVMPARVLIAGAGEILPYVIRKWEPSGYTVVGVDLSRRSLLRARWRTPLAQPWTKRPVVLLQADLAEYLAPSGTDQAGQFRHIDAYGVIHHMPNPAAALCGIAAHLEPGGTLRMMVYNTPARRWIHQLQRAFALLQLSPLAAGDIATAQTLLSAAAAASPSLHLRLGQVGQQTMTNAARFCDLFLHPREARTDVAAWFARLDQAGLRVMGLFDRYAELDDLPNPLWRPPTAHELAIRADDGRFENNLELHATHALLAVPGPRPKPLLLRFQLKRPPPLWFSFRETEGISIAWRLRLWQAHLAWVLHGKPVLTDRAVLQLPMAACARLARIGCLLPGQIRDHGLRQALMAPLATTMDAPARPDTVPLAATPLAAALRACLAAKGITDERRFQAVLARFTLAPR